MMEQEIYSSECEIHSVWIKRVDELESESWLGFIVFIEWLIQNSMNGRLAGCKAEKYLQK